MAKKWTAKDGVTWKKIQVLDLSLPRRGLLKLLNTEPTTLSLEGMSPEEWVSAAESSYRRFLFLAYKHPRASLVPNLKIDGFWHHHILCTRQYASDCKRVLGRFLHHTPDKAVVAAKATQARREGMESLFLGEFGQPLQDRYENPNDGGGCRSAPCEVLEGGHGGKH